MPPEGRTMRRVGENVLVDQFMQDTIEALDESRPLFSSPANLTQRIARRDSKAQFSPRQDDHLRQRKKKYPPVDDNDGVRR
eukprot:1188753-Pyramimonas_sp.AAC.1